MADVFISYKSDDRAVAQLLAGALREHELLCWFDQGLGGDTPFHEQIAEQLANASAVVALWSSSSCDSRWVYSEADEADKQRKLINARLDATLPPKPFDRLNAHDLSGWSGDTRDRRFQSLIEDIRRVMVRGTGQAVAQRGAPTDLPATRAWLHMQNSLSEQDYEDFLAVHGDSPHAAAARENLAMLRRFAAIDRYDADALQRFILDGPFQALGEIAQKARDEARNPAAIQNSMVLESYDSFLESNGNRPAAKKAKKNRDQLARYLSTNRADADAFKSLLEEDLFPALREAISEEGSLSWPIGGNAYAGFAFEIVRYGLPKDLPEDQRIAIVRLVEKFVEQNDALRDRIQKAEKSVNSKSHYIRARDDWYNEFKAVREFVSKQMDKERELDRGDSTVAKPFTTIHLLHYLVKECTELPATVDAHLKLQRPPPDWYNEVARAAYFRSLKVSVGGRVSAMNEKVAAASRPTPAPSREAPQSSASVINPVEQRVNQAQRPQAGSEPARSARSGGLGFAIFAVLLTAGAGAFYFSTVASSRLEQVDALAFEVLPYTGTRLLVARESGLRFRALPFARPDVSIVRESSGGEVLAILGVVNQADGGWYQVRLDGGNVAYFKASLAVPQAEYVEEQIPAADVRQREAPTSQESPPLN